MTTGTGPARVRLACIDIGSNTTRLLVADRVPPGLVEVHQERAFTHIGRRLAGDGAIAADKIEETVAVVVAQMAIARGHGAGEIRAVATAAVRNAPNGDELVAAIARRAGLVVTVLSAEEEARLAFIGAVAMCSTPAQGEVGVIDVGGGSSEVVVGQAPDRVGWWASVAIGSGALTDSCLGSDPPGPAELATARAAVSAAFAGLQPPVHPVAALAVGGSATSLAHVSGPVLTPDTLERSLAILTAEPAGVVAQRFDIDPQRARLLPAGLLILQGAARLLRASLTVGRGGIREGVLLQV